MAFKDTVVEFIVKGRDLFTPAATKAEQAAKSLEAASKQLNDQLSNIESQQASIARYEQLEKALKTNEQRYKDAGLALKELVTTQKTAQQTERDHIAEIKKSEQALERLNALQKEAGASGEQYTSVIKKQELELVELKTKQQAAAAQVLEYNLQVKQARSEVNGLSTSISKNRTEFAQLETTLTKTGKDLNNLNQESKELAQQQAAAEASIADVNNKLEKQTRVLNASKKSTQDYNGSIKQVTKDLIIMGSAYIGLDKVKDSFLGILSAGDKAAEFKARMTAIMGSIEAGEQATAWIKDFANNTGTRFNGALEAFTRLKTFGIDPMNGSMQALVDYNAKLGGSQEKLEGIILAAGQAWAKQKLQGEEILQMVERGIPVWDLLSTVTGKNTFELQKMSEKGQLSRETMKALFDEMGKQADGQAAKSLDRLSGQVTLISNKWEQFKIKIADSGVYQVAIDFMKQLNEQFDKLVKDGSIDLAAQKISQFFSSMITDGGESFRVLLENINGFISGAERVVGALRIVWNGFTAGIKTVAMAATEYAGSMTDAFASVLDFVGADELAQKAQFQADALKAVSQGFYDSILEDGKNLNSAWEQLTQTSTEQVKTTVNAANEAVKTNVDAQKENIATVTETAVKAVNDLSIMMSKAGIITTESLKTTEEQAKLVYDTLLESYKNNEIGVYELEQAYLKWADAAIDTAGATKGTVPPTIEATAAALGLTKELEKLIAESKKLAPANDTNSESVKRFTAEIKSTNDAIDQNKKVLESSTATSAQKAEAQRLLIIQQARLTEQTDDLIKVQELEKSNLYSLQREQNNLTSELESLNQAYKTGTLSAEDYSQKKERISDILDVVNRLLGDFKTAQNSATAATKASTQATNDQAKASSSAAKSLREQQAEIEKVSQSYTNAARSAQSYSQTSKASVSTIVDYQEENGSAYQLSSREILAEKGRRLSETLSGSQYDKFSKELNSAKSISALTELYNKINKQLTYLNADQKKQLNEAIKTQKAALNESKKAVSSTASNINYSYSEPSNNSSYSKSTSNYSSSSNQDLSEITTLLKSLINGTVTSGKSPSKVIRLQLMLPGEIEITADIIDEIEDGVLSKLEQLGRTQ
ncbi:MAG: tape measure domain-containing protein [Pseudoalteromonas distincta]|jgi:tape measure domain-containing protein